MKVSAKAIRTINKIGLTATLRKSAAKGKLTF